MHTSVCARQCALEELIAHVTLTRSKKSRHFQVVELREKEEAEEEDAKVALKAAEAAALMQQANLDGVDTLFDDMTAGDDEWAKLAQVLTY